MKRNAAFSLVFAGRYFMKFVYIVTQILTDKIVQDENFIRDCDSKIHVCNFH